LLDGNLESDQRHYVELIQVAGSALLTVANDILDFSSIEAGQIRLQKAPFSLETLIYNTVSLVRRGAGNEEVPIRTGFDPDLPSLVLGDEARLRQILLNLLNNAVKFTPKGHITVRVAQAKSTGTSEAVQISVTDTGIGIASDKLHRLFKRFSQVDPSIRREFGGTGLGLAISKHLIELMGGEIGVASEQGNGSTFWIKVPLPGTEGPSHHQIVREDAVPVAPAKILLAEDIAINRELAHTLLTGAGHEVDVVHNGADAIAAVQEKAYDIVLMDIQMPLTDGITATRMIRTLPHPTGSVVIIALTANVLPEHVRTFLDAGMNDYVGKPFTRNNLLEKLSRWLPVKDTPHAAQSAATDQDQIQLGSKDLQDFIDVLGTEKVRNWLMNLDQQLQNTFSGNSLSQDNRRYLASVAHAVIPQAGLLGFAQLAEVCIALEHACNEGRDLGALFAKAQEVAHAVRRDIALTIEKLNRPKSLCNGVHAAG
jgi:CheY-like chemotaxis protein/HPt (histidine-containing phosphotransfer) domain-containing protein